MSANVILGTIYDADCLDGIDFEYWCAALLQRNGFTHVVVTSASGDQGVDILANKGDIRYAIQCKRYNSPLNNKPIQEVYTGRVHYGCERAAVMTNNYFKPGAIELGKSTDVELWDRDQLIYWLDISDGKNTFVSNVNRRIKVHNAKPARSRRPSQGSRRLGRAFAKHPIRTLLLVLFLIAVIMPTGSESNTAPSSGLQTRSTSKGASITANKPSNIQEEYVSCNGISAKMRSMNAKTIDYVGYDSTEQVLVVHIPRYRAFYLYYSFPPEKYDSFVASEYPDVYFNNSIGGQYETVKVPEEDAESTLSKHP